MQRIFERAPIFGELYARVLFLELLHPDVTGGLLETVQRTCGKFETGLIQPMEIPNVEKHAEGFLKTVTTLEKALQNETDTQLRVLYEEHLLH